MGQRSGRRYSAAIFGDLAMREAPERLCRIHPALTLLRQRSWMPRISTVARRPALAALLAVAILAGLAAPAAAHPHVFVTARAEILYAPDGTVRALKHVWSFDEAYSAYITQGLDKNGDGRLTADELAELAKINVESLPEVGFFTTAKANGKPQEFGTPAEAGLVFENKILTLTYTLPLKVPAHANRSFGIEIGDPTYFVAFDIVDAPDAVITRDAPKGCIVRVARPPKLDPAVQQKLAQEDITATPDTSGLQVTTRALVACP
jgi:ABC-type uncharacterized transport system substrate-binding protein